MKRPVRILLTVVAVIAVIVCIFCILFIVQYVRGKSVSDKLGSGVRSGQVVEPLDPQDDGKYMAINVDFDSLHDVNPEMDRGARHQHQLRRGPECSRRPVLRRSRGGSVLLLRRQHFFPAVQHHHLPGPGDGAVWPQPPVPDHVCPGEQLCRCGVFRQKPEDLRLHPGQGV